MEIENVRKTETRNKILSIRTYKSYCEFMSKNDISPSKVFNESIKELMNKSNIRCKNKWRYFWLVTITFFMVILYGIAIDPSIHIRRWTKLWFLSGMKLLVKMI